MLSQFSFSLLAPTSSKQEVLSSTLKESIVHMSNIMVSISGDEFDSNESMVKSRAWVGKHNWLVIK